MNRFMRIDRLLTLALFRFLRRAARKDRGKCLPILMYHSISDTPEAETRAYYRTTTTPKRFAEQMTWLQQNGWRGVTLREGLAWLQQQNGGRASVPTALPSAVSFGGQRGPPSSAADDVQLEGRPPCPPISPPRPNASADSPPHPPPRPVVLTIDDGFRDFLTAAVPAMREMGFRATMYLVTDHLTERGAPREFKGRPCLTWDEVRDLHADGFEFGSHTASHPELIRVDRGELLRQLTASRDAIVHHLNEPVTSFAYPYAFPSERNSFVRDLRAFLTEADYQTCVTTSIGRVRKDDDLLVLPRLPVNQADDTDLFAAKTNGYYDWTGEMQAHFKRIRKIVRAVRGRA